MSEHQVIKARELTATAMSSRHKGARIQWEHRGVTWSLILDKAWLTNNNTGVHLMNEYANGGIVDVDTDIAVLEPAPVPPLDEPSERGAIVEDGVGNWWAKGSGLDWHRLTDYPIPRHWDLVLEVHGPLRLISRGPGVEAKEKGPAPTAPSRVEKWPEDDEHLRAHEWIDMTGDVWFYKDQQWFWRDSVGEGRGEYKTPLRGPWTRVPRTWCHLDHVPNDVDYVVDSQGDKWNRTTESPVGWGFHSPSGFAPWRNVASFDSQGAEYGPFTEAYVTSDAQAKKGEA